MKDSVSSRWFSVFALLASLSVVWVACSIFVPYGFPWMGLGWVGLALSAALWVRMGSTRSIAEVLQDVESEPIPAVAAKPARLPARIWAHVAWLSLLPVFLFAGPLDPAANLSACKNGWPSCERSRLTLVEMTEVALAGHMRNVSNCRNGLNPCDQWKLTKVEAIAVAVAVYDRNLSNCKAGLNPCAHSRLTRSEAREVAVAEHQRQVSHCKDGTGPCDPSTLTELEVADVARVQR